MKRALRVGVIAFVAWIVLWQGVFKWGFCRVWVAPDQMLVVVSQVGDARSTAQGLADEEEQGIRADVLGPGRHFLNPLTHSWEHRQVIKVDAGRSFEVTDGVLTAERPPSVGVVTSLVGDPPPPGQVLASDGGRGIQRRVLTPGVYRLNPYAYRVEVHPATVIQPGFVGVITHQLGPNTRTELAAEDEKGVLARVLPAGIHYLNPYEYRVTPLKVGYQELTFEEKTAISFPASDSNMVKIDATVIWGLNPSDAPFVVKRFGEDLVDRVLRPQAESVVRLAGSNYNARQLIEGDTRETFQQAVRDNLTVALEEKHIRVLLVLIRTVEVPNAVREPIQKERIAQEEGVTYQVEAETAKVLQRLHEAEGNVMFAQQQAEAETARFVAEELARGKAAAAEIRSETESLVADTVAQIAELKKQILGIYADAEAIVRDAEGAADAEALQRTVTAFGDPQAYALWRFAEGLPEDLQIELRHAGDGTLWTDLQPSDAAVLTKTKN